MGAEIRGKVAPAGDPPPADPKELTFLAVDTRALYMTESDGADAGETAHYMLRWVSTTGEKGPWSERASATVGAQWNSRRYPTRITQGELLIGVLIMASLQDLGGTGNAGDGDLPNRVELFLKILRTRDARASRFASNLAHDKHWEHVDALRLYVVRLLNGEESGKPLGENCWNAFLDVVEKCQEDGYELPHPGHGVHDCPGRLCHVFWKEDWKGQLQANTVDAWGILTSPLFNDPGFREALREYEDICLRTGEPSYPPYASAWATFDEAGSEHPFNGPAFNRGAGVPIAERVVSALGMDYNTGEDYALARYPSDRIGEVRMPTVCDGRDGKRFKACGRTDPGRLPERLHRPLRVRDLDRHLMVLAKA